MLNFYHRLILDSDTQIISPYSLPVQVYIDAIIDDYLLQKPPSQIYFLLHLDTGFFHDKLILEGNAIFGYSEEAWHYAPRIAYRMSDYVTFFAGLNIWTGGSKGGFLGRNEKRDNFFMRLQLEI